MSRRRNPEMERLRRLATAGDKAGMAALLQELMQKEPGNQRWQEEWERLQRGEVPAVLRTVAKDRLCAALRKDLADTDEKTRPELWDATTFRKLCERVRQGRALPTLLFPEKESPAFQRLERLLQREKRRRAKPLLRRLLAGTAVLLALGAAGGTGYYLHGQAVEAADLMAAAWESGKVKEEKRVLAAMDPGLNRLFCRRVGFEAARLRTRLQAQTQRREEAEALLQELESGARRVTELSSAQREDLEQLWQDFAGMKDNLQQRWQSCCEREAAAHREEKAAVLQQLMEPLPELPELSGTPKKDAEALHGCKQELEARTALLQKGRLLYGVGEEPEEALEERCRQLELLTHELDRYQQMLALLPSARSYVQYRKLLGDEDYVHYTPAAFLTALRENLPKTARLREDMQQYSHGIPAGLLPDVRLVFLERQCSFCASNPASPQQLQLMEDLFTNRCLHRPLIALSRNGKDYLYSEQEPEIREDSVRFRRSTLDPQKKVGDSAKITWDHPEQVLRRRVDTTPLAETAGLEREHFFRRANLPSVLTNVLNLRAPQTPALARAYVYNTLLQVWEEIEEPELSGSRFAPTLLAHAASFREMIQELGVEIDGQCWLRNGAAYLRAEERCQLWFREHSGADYAAEIAAGLGNAMNVTPKYCGYINLQGNPVWTEPPAENAPLWVLTDEGLRRQTNGDSMEDALPLSPLFTLKKL